MGTTVVEAEGGWTGWVRRLRGSRGQEAVRAVYEELLYLAGKTQTMEELLTRFPERLCAAMELGTFHVFVRERGEYVVRGGGSERRARESERRAVAASSSTVLRMKRDRRPAMFVRDGVEGVAAEGWQMLATAEEVEVLRAVDAQVLVPMEGRTGLMGFATMSRAGHRGFAEEELRFLRELGPEMGRGLETAQMIGALSEQAVERARAHRELELAREVQERLLPVALPVVEGMDVVAAYRSAEQIGGDYYDVFRAGERVWLAVGDVSGKGVPGALLMAALRASMHALVGEGMGVTEVVRRINDLLYEGSAANRYATLFVGVYAPGTRRLEYVNAGHNPPMLVRADGRVEMLTVGGMVVGLLPGGEFASEVLEMEPGATLVAYTDGVTEANDAAKGEWGEESLRAAVVAACADPATGAAGVMDRVMEGVTRFTGDVAQSDDLTLVVLRVG